MKAISPDLAAHVDTERHGSAPGPEAPRILARFLTSRRLTWPVLRTLVTVSSWVICLAFLWWAARLAFLEGYWYEIKGDFLGDFTRTAELGAPTWFTGHEIFYGPIFVLEYRFVFQPGIFSPADFARLDYVLFGAAFLCAWLALFGAHRPRLAIFVLAAWLANHMSIEAFSNTAHLEVLELALISLGLLCAVRRRLYAAGATLGLAIATKTLPGLFLPYFALTRQWRMFAAASVFASVPFLLVCWLQGVTPWAGLYSLIYQGGNLTKLEYSEYEYTPRAEIARILAGPGGTVSTQQAQLAIGLHWIIAIVAVVLVAWVLSTSRIVPATYGLMFGLIGAVLLVVAPSAHASYYIFLLPGWTAILAELVRKPLSPHTAYLWAALIAAYTFTGFDQPFFVAQRLFGFGIVVPQNWLNWHLPTLGLVLTLTSLSVLLLARPAGQSRRVLQPLAAQ